MVTSGGPALAQDASGAAQPGDAEEAPQETPVEEPSTPTAPAIGPAERMRLSDGAELDRAVNLYRSGSYADCSSSLAELLDPNSSQPFSDSAVIEKGRLYFASCEVLQGNDEQARQVLREALEQNPLMTSPDSLTFPPPLVTLFLEVRDEVQQLIAAQEKEQVVQLRRENELARRRAEQREFRERELEKLARQESVVVKNSRALASLPFGVGQYQNGNRSLGALFLVSEAVLLGTAITSGLILEDLTSQAADGDFELADDVVTQYNNQTAAAHTALTWSTWGFVGVAALGVLEAHLNFESERRIGVRKRPLPPELEKPAASPSVDSDTSIRVRPTMGVLPGGGLLGVSGKF